MQTKLFITSLYRIQNSKPILPKYLQNIAFLMFCIHTVKRILNDLTGMYTLYCKTSTLIRVLLLPLIAQIAFENKVLTIPIQNIFPLCYHIFFDEIN